MGVWGLAVLPFFLLAVPGVLADDTTDHGRIWVAPVLALGVLAVLTAYGAVRLAQAPTTFVSGVRLRIMQPHPPHDYKFYQAAKPQVMSRYLPLSLTAA